MQAGRPCLRTQCGVCSDVTWVNWDRASRVGGWWGRACFYARLRLASCAVLTVELSSPLTLSLLDCHLSRINSTHNSRIRSNNGKVDHKVRNSKSVRLRRSGAETIKMFSMEISLFRNKLSRGVNMTTCRLSYERIEEMNYEFHLGETYLVHTGSCVSNLTYKYSTPSQDEYVNHRPRHALLLAAALSHHPIPRSMPTEQSRVRQF